MQSRFLTYLTALMLLLWGGMVPVWGDDDDFNPENPPEPYLTYHLTAEAIPANGGTATGTGDYMPGTSVTLRATAKPGYYFVRWTKQQSQVSTSANYSVTTTASQDMRYVAEFAKYSVVTVTASPSAGGTVSGAGSSYKQGTTVNLSATPRSGYFFDHWTLNGQDYATTASCAYIATGDTARFVAYFSTQPIEPEEPEDPDNAPDFNPENPPEPNLNPNDFKSKVYLLADPEGSCTFNRPAVADYVEESRVVFTCTPRTNYKFIGWFVGDSLAEATQSFTLTIPRQDITYTAHLIYEDPNQNTSGGDDGEEEEEFNPDNPPEPGSALGPDDVVDNRQTQLIYAPDSVGYHFVRWTDGVTANPRTELLSCQTVFVPVYEINTYRVAATWLNATGVAGVGTYNYGDTVRLTVSPREHYHLLSWSNDSTCNPLQFVIRQDTSFQAICAIDSFEVQTPQVEHGTVSGGGTYPYNSVVILEATPEPGFRFLQWQDGVTAYRRAYTATADTTFIAEFTLGTYYFLHEDTICEFDDYEFGDHDLTFLDPGRYHVCDTFQSVFETDSIEELYLTVGATYLFTEMQTIRLGKSYAWHGQTYRPEHAGIFTYNDTLISSLGCDSVYSLALTAETFDAYPLDYREDFNTGSVSVLEDWTRYSGRFTGTSVSTSSLSKTSSGWSIVSAAPINNTHARVNVYGSSCRYWLVSPSINTAAAEGDTLLLTFDATITSYSTSRLGSAQTSGTDDRFAVIISDDNGVTWKESNAFIWSNTAGAARSYNGLNGSIQHVSLDLSAYGNKKIKIALYGESTVSNADNYLHIDNIELKKHAFVPEEACTATITVRTSNEAYGNVSISAQRPANNR